MNLTVNTKHWWNNGWLLWLVGEQLFSFTKQLRRHLPFPLYWRIPALSTIQYIQYTYSIQPCESRFPAGSMASRHPAQDSWLEPVAATARIISGSDSICPTVVSIFLYSIVPFTCSSVSDDWLNIWLISRYWKIPVELRNKIQENKKKKYQGKN